MLRYLLPVLLCFTINFSLNAQQFKAGLIAGVAATQISGDQLGGFDKPGFAGGGYVRTEVSQKFDISMQILYVEKGSLKKANTDKGDFEYYKLKLNYFEVPLLLQWKYSKRFIFEIGPTFGVLLFNQEEDEFGIYEPVKAFNKYELGICGGMDVNIVKQLSFNARLESSVLPVREHVSGLSYRLNSGQFNAALIFSLQYQFGNKNKTEP